MATDDPASRGFSLKRWSQRKRDAARVAPAAEAVASARETAAAAAPTQPATTTPTAAAAEPTAAEPALPSIESLTIDSDFSAFLAPKVDPAIKHQALKKLFSDPRFNVMDGLDVYIDDYSIPDPLAPEIARTLAHARYIFDPPRTRVSEAGIVEDVPPGEASIDARALPQEAAPTSPVVAAASEATVPAEPAPLPRPDAAAGHSAADSPTGEAKAYEGSGPARR
jgi:hypothetical protein